MTSGPWLTIVTVVKDDADGLERTLRSLLGADLKDVEHLIIREEDILGVIEN